MEQNIGYIKSIKITGLWGKQDILWNLRPDANILSGINGSGKSSILRAVYKTLYFDRLEYIEEDSSFSKIWICFSDNEEIRCESVEAKSVSESVEKASLSSEGEIRSVERKKDSEYYVVGATKDLDDFIDILFINNFDRPLIDSDAIQKLSDKRVKTELDWQLYKLQSAYLSYQVNIGNRIIKLLSSDDISSKEKATSISAKKVLFQDIIDDLFCATNKQIDRSKNEIQFISGNETLSPYQLSAGEKQVLVILLTVLIQDEKPCILLMDEPEISLHIEWQKKLINLIRDINPKVQIILATHSPAVIMNGWIDAVTEVSDISTIYVK